jgi:hypothetical protein
MPDAQPLDHRLGDKHANRLFDILIALQTLPQNRRSMQFLRGRQF